MQSELHPTTDPRGPVSRTTSDVPAVEEILLSTPRRPPVIPPVAVAAMGIVLTVGLPLAGTLSPGHALEVALVVVAISALVALVVSCVVLRTRMVGLEGRQAEDRLVEPPLRSDGSGSPQLALAESRRQLVAWVSDDLRTPLASLRTTAGALENGVIHDPEHVARALASMRFEADRLSEMLTDLFELSDAPGSDGSRAPADLVADTVRLRATRAAAVPTRIAAGERNQSTFDLAFRVDAVAADVSPPVVGPGS
ncbi:MAG: histidine kinase dimerization/phospho-acceptor domain-containing protein [Iamia sp.]